MKKQMNAVCQQLLPTGGQVLGGPVMHATPLVPFRVRSQAPVCPQPARSRRDDELVTAPAGTTVGTAAGIPVGTSAGGAADSAADAVTVPGLPVVAPPIT